MKLKFDATLEYQHEAIASVVDLFEGLPARQGTFEVNTATRGQMELFTELGVGNPMMIDDALLLKNLHAVQELNNTPKSRFLVEKESPYPFPNFSVEMETGTGKTYVYLRTIFELNRKYGF